MRLRFTVAVAFTLALPASVMAQSVGVYPRVGSLPASTRAMALGGAYMMNSGHADALFYHPALLVDAGGFGIDLQAWGSGSTSAAASAAMAWYGGGVGIGLQTLQFGWLGSGSSDLEDGLFDEGDTAATERVATVGYAHSVFGIRLGLAAKLLQERLGATESSALLLDVGAAHRIGPFTLGLTVQDIGDEPMDGKDGIELGRVVLGAGAYGRQVGIFDVGVTGAVSYTSDETLAGAGVEVGYWPIAGRTFVARVGVQTVPTGSDASPLTFGFAFWGDDLVLEWAYRRFGALDEGTHRFGVRWR
jgi:hypothetical protein